MRAASTTVRKIGNSQGLIIEKGFCDAMGLSVGSVVNIALEGDCMTITPVEDRRTLRIGACKGRKLAPDSWFDEEFELEIAEMMGAGR